jgi:hypothetical protein
VKLLRYPWVTVSTETKISHSIIILMTSWKFELWEIRLWQWKLQTGVSVYGW